jgi:hypothetical protein
MEYPAPDCESLVLPGDPADVALTPRPDRDAEILALSIDPSRAVASQARYDVVAQDLAAIRTDEPILQEVPADCVIPNAIGFRFTNETMDVMIAILTAQGVYEAWDCHNTFYGYDGPLMTDGVSLAIVLDGVYGSAVADGYAALPGLDEVHDYWIRWDEDGNILHHGWHCEPWYGTIELHATFRADGGLHERTYGFEHPEAGRFVYRVVGEAPPERLE